MGSTYKYIPEHLKKRPGRKKQEKHLKKFTQSICLHYSDWAEVKKLAGEMGVNQTRLIETAIKYYFMLDYKKKADMVKLSHKTIKEIKEKLDEINKD